MRFRLRGRKLIIGLSTSFRLQIRARSSVAFTYFDQEFNGCLKWQYPVEAPCRLYQQTGPLYFYIYRCECLAYTSIQLLSNDFTKLRCIVRTRWKPWKFLRVYYVYNRYTSVFNTHSTHTHKSSTLTHTLRNAYNAIQRASMLHRWMRIFGQCAEITLTTNNHSCRQKSSGWM